jgi:hypothetical protein
MKLGMSKNLMIAKYPQEVEEIDDFQAGGQADDWSRITSLGLSLPGPEDYETKLIPF